MHSVISTLFISLCAQRNEPKKGHPGGELGQTHRFAHTSLSALLTPNAYLVIPESETNRESIIDIFVDSRFHGNDSLPSPSLLPLPHAGEGEPHN